MSNTDRHTRLTAGLRRTAFATIVALLVEYAFGLFLFGTTPTSAHGAGLLSAFGLSIATGPAALVIHAILGSLIVIGGVMSLLRAIQSRSARMIIVNVIAAVAVALAWLAGSATADDPMGPSGRVMGIATGIAILAYAWILFVAPKDVGRGTARAS